VKFGISSKRPPRAQHARAFLLGWSRGLVLVILALLGAAGRAEHEYYVGVAECRYFPEAKLWIWEQKLFTDDLETAYNAARPNRKLRLDESGIRVDTAVASWLQGQMGASIGRKKIDWELISRVSSPESTVLRWKSKAPDPQGKTLFVYHRALRASFPKQMNLVHVRRGEFRSSHAFKEDDDRWTVQIP